MRAHTKKELLTKPVDKPQWIVFAQSWSIELCYSYTYYVMIKLIKAYWLGWKEQQKKSASIKFSSSINKTKKLQKKKIVFQSTAVKLCVREPHLTKWNWSRWPSFPDTLTTKRLNKNLDNVSCISWVREAITKTFQDRNTFLQSVLHWLHHDGRLHKTELLALRTKWNTINYSFDF